MRALVRALGRLRTAAEMVEPLVLDPQREETGFRITAAEVRRHGIMPEGKWEKP